MPSPVPDTHPYERQIVRAERETSTILAAALEQMRQQVWRGITADNVREVLSRLQSRDVNEALAAAIMRALDPVAQMGVEHGRASVEQQIFGVKAAQTAVDIGFDWTLANTAARVNLQQYSFNLYYAGEYSITAATERALRGYIDQFIATGGSLRDLEQQVAYLFAPHRAEKIAITEVTRAYALGNLAAWEASGVVDRKEWRTARDELVCPICAPLNGKQAALGETFDGVVASPPAHPRCRCFLAPVVDVPEMDNTTGAGGTTPQEPKPLPMAKMIELENSIVDNDFETAGVFDEDGNLIFKKLGGKNYVQFSDEEMAQMKGRILTHNHPSGRSFSFEDLAMTRNTRLKEIRAVGTGYDGVTRTYRLTVSHDAFYTMKQETLNRAWAQARTMAKQLTDRTYYNNQSKWQNVDFLAELNHTNSMHVIEQFMKIMTELLGQGVVDYRVDIWR